MENLITGFYLSYFKLKIDVKWIKLHFTDLAYVLNIYWIDGEDAYPLSI